MSIRLDTGNKIVGTKQVKRAILEEDVDTVFIAEDAEDRLVKDIECLCGKNSLDIVYVETMEELGSACGIEVGAASAALLK